MAPALQQYIEFFGRPAIEIHADKRPEPKLFATTTQPLTLREWQGHGANPEFKEIPLPAGSTVRIVMYSRFGDVGITNNLKADRGYDLRVDPMDGLLTDWRDKP